MLRFYSLIPVWCDTDAAEHRIQLDHEPLDRIRWVSGRRRSMFAIKDPDVAPFPRRLLLRVAGRQHSRVQARATLEGSISIGANFIEMDGDGVSDHRAFDIERSGLRIAGETIPTGSFTATCGVQGLGTNCIARDRVQSGTLPRRKGAVIHCRDEVVDGGCIGGAPNWSSTD